MLKKISLITLFSLSLFSGIFNAFAASVPVIVIEDHMARPATKGRNGAVFMKIVNKGTKSSVLKKVSSPVAREVQLHLTLQDSDIMKMRKLEHIDCPAAQTVELKSGGLHIMLMGLKQDLVLNEKIPVSLEFQGGHIIKLSVAVQKGECCHECVE